MTVGHVCREPRTSVEALERLARLARAARLLPRLPRVEATALRMISAEMAKYMVQAAPLIEALLGREEAERLLARCGRLANEAQRAASAIQFLEASGAPGPHGEAARRLAELLAGDPCMKALEEAWEKLRNGARGETS